jgi:hypothetical protein
MGDGFARTVTFFTLLAAVAAGWLGWSLTQNYYRGQAIERGYALHCPTDGRFAWMGECDE